MIEKDPEILALSQTLEAVKHLNKNQVGRIMQWVSDRFGIRSDSVFAAPEPSAPVQVEWVQKEEGVKKVTPLADLELGEEPETSKTPRKKELTDYDSIADLFKDANVKKVSSRILLMAAYLQEKQHYKEVNSMDINFRLKRLGLGIGNISSSINGILKRKPVVLVESGKGSGSRGRRKYNVTAEGIKVANSFLKGA